MLEEDITCTLQIAHCTNSCNNTFELALSWDDAAFSNCTLLAHCALHIRCNSVLSHCILHIAHCRLNIVCCTLDLVMPFWACTQLGWCSLFKLLTIAVFIWFFNCPWGARAPRWQKILHLTFIIWFLKCSFRFEQREDQNYIDWCLSAFQQQMDNLAMCDLIF